MKKDLHPDYRPVVFRDKSGNFSFLTGSTSASNETIVWTDGKTYPVVDVEISSATHPFYTGNQRVMDTQGRVEKFKKRYGQL
ncbi:type B 50S ribosomal protein L31 [Kribbella sp. NPDC020789]